MLFTHLTFRPFVTLNHYLKILGGDARIKEIVEKVDSLEKDRDKELGTKLSEFESELREKEQATFLWFLQKYQL